MAHETDYQRARRQRSEVKEHDITGSTPTEAAERIKAHTSAKKEAIARKMKVKDESKEYRVYRDMRHKDSHKVAHLKFGEVEKTNHGTVRFK